MTLAPASKIESYGARQDNNEENQERSKRALLHGGFPLQLGNRSVSGAEYHLTRIARKTHDNTVGCDGRTTERVPKYRTPGTRINYRNKPNCATTIGPKSLSTVRAPSSLSEPSSVNQMVDGTFFSFPEPFDSPTPR